MISLQRLLGRPKEFYGLLEQSAQLGAKSVSALKELVGQNGQGAPTLDKFVQARRDDKAVIKNLEELLTRVFVTPIEREDLESIANSLYRLPKTVEKFAERYEMAHDRIRGVDFTLVAHFLESAAGLVVEMVKNLSGTGALAEVKSLDARLAQIESDSNRVILEATKKLRVPGADALTAIIAADLFDILSDCVSACRAIGRNISLTILKNS